MKKYWGNCYLGNGQVLTAARKGDGLRRALDELRHGVRRAYEHPLPRYFYCRNIRHAPSQIQPVPPQKPLSPNVKPATLARRRALIAAAVWAFLSFVIVGTNSMADPGRRGSYGFASGSHAIVTWTLIFMVAGGFAIDLAIGAGTTTAFMTGAAIGFAINTYAAFSEPDVAHHPLDISLFWLTAVFGLIGYLFSALARQKRDT